MFGLVRRRPHTFLTSTALSLSRVVVTKLGCGCPHPQLVPPPPHANNPSVRCSWNSIETGEFVTSRRAVITSPTPRSENSVNSNCPSADLGLPVICLQRCNTPGLSTLWVSHCGGLAGKGGRLLSGFIHRSSSSIDAGRTCSSPSKSSEGTSTFRLVNGQIRWNKTLLRRSSSRNSLNIID